MPSTLVTGGTMMHVQMSGVVGQVYQYFTSNLPANKAVHGCVWVYTMPASNPILVDVVTPGSAGNPGAITTMAGHWEVLNTSSSQNGLSGRPGLIQIIAGSVDGASDFYIESSTVTTSQGQCKPAR